MNCHSINFAHTHQNFFPCSPGICSSDYSLFSPFKTRSSLLVNAQIPVPQHSSNRTSAISPPNPNPALAITPTSSLPHHPRYFFSPKSESSQLNKHIIVSLLYKSPNPNPRHSGLQHCGCVPDQVIRHPTWLASESYSLALVDEQYTADTVHTNLNT